MKLVLHAGFHKTGSSAIQAFCKKNRGRLAERGLLYPSVGLTNLEYTSTPTSEAGHRAFQDVLVAPVNLKSEARLEALMNEAKSFSDVHTVVISSETFSAPRIKISESLHEALGAHFSEIKVLLYLRRQDEWAESFYKEVLCWPGRRYRRSFKRFVNDFLTEWLDYDARIDKWADVFGERNLIVKSYDDRAEKNIVVDFFSEFGLDLASDEGFEFPGFNNPSLPNDLVALMQYVNNRKLSREQRSRITNRIYNELAESDYRVTAPTVLTPAIRQSLTAEFQPMNRAICERFKIEPGERLCFGGEIRKSSEEVSLRGEQVDAIKAMADDLARSTRHQNQPMKGRKDQGRVGISCLLNEDPLQVKVFVFYHLALGVSRIRLYFDNPDDEMAAYDYGTDKVEIVRCTADFWQQQIGREPENNGEKLSTCHKHGLNDLNKREDIDWVINLDADELLFVRPGTTLAEYLASVAARHLQVQVRPLEAVFVSDEDSELFNARYFKVPRINLKGKRFPRGKGILRMGYYSALYLAEKISNLALVRKMLLSYSGTTCMFLAWSEKDEMLYRKHMPQLSKIMRDGFLAHRLGRIFTRHGIEFDRVTSHKPEFSGRGAKTLMFNNTVFVLHFDAADFSAWHLKWHRRIYGDTTASAIHDKRRLQQDLFKEACENGEQAVRDLFESFFVFPREALDDLQQAGLLVELDLPLLKKIRKQVGL